MPKKNKKPRKPTNTPLQNFSKVYRNSRKPFQVISNHRKLIAYTDYFKVFDVIEKENLNASKLVSEYYLPKKVSNIHRIPPLKKVNLLAELYWAAARIKKNSTHIKAFLRLRESINNSFKKRDFEGSLSDLKKLDSKVCQSIWSISRQQAAHQKISGLDGNKKFTNSLLEDKDSSPLCRYLINIISSRNEDATDINWLHKTYFPLIENSDLEDGLKIYCHYNVYRPLCSITDHESILRHSANASLIDLYESLLFALTDLIYEDLISKDHILFLLNQLTESIPDFRFKKLLFLVSSNPLYLDGFETLNIESFELTRDRRFSEKNNPVNQEKFENIYECINFAKFFADIGKTPNNQRVLNFWKVLNKGNEFYNHYHTILKEALDAAPAEDEFIISNFFRMELSPSPVKAHDNIDLHEFVYCNYIAPTHFLCIKDNATKKAFTQFLNSKHNNSIIVNSYLELVDGEHDSQVLKNEKNDYELISFIEKNIETDTKKASDAAFNLYQSQNIRMRRYGARYYAFFLEKSEEYKKLIEFVGNSLVNDKGTRFNLPLENVGNLLDKETRRQFADVIDISIILSFIINKNDNDEDRRLIYAYEDYLRSQGINKPSEINYSKVTDKEHLKKLIYFLEHICTHAVISNSIIFGSDSEVEDERLKIYKILKELAPENSEKYDDESEKILKQQSIRNVIQHVEQSKIYVDIDKIRTWAHKNINTSFNRYMSFVKAGLGSENNNDTKIQKKLKLRTQEKSISSLDDLLSIGSTNEAYEILVEMLRLLMKEFFHNAAYGLDSNLSVNIRHGWLPAELREPFSKNRIITQKGSNSEKYESNEYWLQLLENNESQTKLDNVLNKFSAHIDGVIERLSKESIQIKSKKHPNGLIQTALPASIITAFAAEISPEDKLDNFLDRVFEIFWAITTAALSRVRGHISTAVAAEITDAIEQLEREVQNLNLDKTLSPLQTNIGYAKHDVQQTLKKLETWFVISEGIIQEPVFIENIINAALSSVIKDKAEIMQPNIIYNAEKDVAVKDNNINVFNNICFIIFENIVKHSGLEGEFDVVIDVEHNDKEVVVEMTNPISRSVNIRKSEKTLSQIRSSIEDGTYVEKINQEGLTGLLKLKQLISTLGTDTDDALEFGIRKKEKEFFVRIKMKVTWGNA